MQNELKSIVKLAKWFAFFFKLNIDKYVLENSVFKREAKKVILRGVISIIYDLFLDLVFAMSLRYEKNRDK